MLIRSSLSTLAPLLWRRRWKRFTIIWRVLTSTIGNVTKELHQETFLVHLRAVHVQWAGPARWAGSVSGQLPPRKFDPRRIAPYIIASQTIAPGDNCPRGKLSPYNYTPEWLLLDYCSRKNYSKDNYPLTIAPGNSHRGKLPFGWFVVYIIVHNCPSDKWSQGKLPPPRKIVPRIKNTRSIFPQES